MPAKAVFQLETKPFAWALVRGLNDVLWPARLDRGPRLRRGGRVVECTALEMRHTGNRIGSSNLPLSATALR